MKQHRARGGGEGEVERRARKEVCSGQTEKKREEVGAA